MLFRSEIRKLSVSSGGTSGLNWQSDSLSYTGIVGPVEEFLWVDSSPGRCILSSDGVRGPEDEGGDGVEKLEGEGDDKLSIPLEGSLADRLPISSAAALARWRLWSRFRQ